MSIPTPPQGSPDPHDSTGSGVETPQPTDPPRYAPPVYAPPLQSASAPAPAQPQPEPTQQPLPVQQPAAPQQPAQAQPGYAPPSYPHPQYAQPGAAQPGYPQPGYLPPGYPQPGYAQPGYAQPGYAQPGYAQPGYQAYSAAPQGFAVPGPGEPFDGATSPEDLTRPLYGANPVQAFVRFFKNYASFSGRASRSEYWWSAMWWFVGSFAFGIISSIVESLSYSAGYGYGSDGIYGSIGLLSFIVALGLVVPQLALTWRRLHDADMPGGLFFIAFFPFLGSLILIILLALPPKVSGRRFARGY